MRRTITRPLTVALALALSPPAVALVPSASSADGTAAASPAPAVVRLSTTEGGISEADLPLGRRLVQQVSGGRRTAALRTSGYSMVGVTWTGSRAPQRVAVRWPAASGGWAAWHTLPAQTDLPAAGEARGTSGTQVVWTGRHTQVQVAVLGNRPSGLRLSLIDTGPAERTPSARSLAASTATTARTATAAAARAHRPTRAPKPALVKRKAWGADPSWRNGTPTYIKKIQQVHIHHTATANRYAPGDVPGLLRGMYWYHTHALGWFDIGYNFLVDRFGRGWVGRSGGADLPVRGAHTLGFNHESVGIAFIGSFTKVRPTGKAMDAAVEIAAWKLDMYGGHPRGTVVVRSRGSDRFAAGRFVRLPVIDGHRDTNQTDCPGARLYALLPKLRQRVAMRVHRFDP
jgi:uncharacterized protein with LGFP repeats